MAREESIWKDFHAYGEPAPSMRECHKIPALLGTENFTEYTNETMLQYTSANKLSTLISDLRAVTTGTMRIPNWLEDTNITKRFKPVSVTYEAWAFARVGENKTCESEGQFMIKTKGNCAVAAAKYGINVTEAEIPEKDWGHMPGGCIILQNNSLILNKAPGNGGSSNYKWELCISQENDAKKLWEEEQLIEAQKAAEASDYGIKPEGNGITTVQTQKKDHGAGVADGVKEEDINPNEKDAKVHVQKKA